MLHCFIYNLNTTHPNYFIFPFSSTVCSLSLFLWSYSSRRFLILYNSQIPYILFFSAPLFVFVFFTKLIFFLSNLISSNSVFCCSRNFSIFPHSNYYFFHFFISFFYRLVLDHPFDRSSIYSSIIYSCNYFYVNVILYFPCKYFGVYEICIFSYLLLYRNVATSWFCCCICTSKSISIILLYLLSLSFLCLLLATDSVCSPIYFLILPGFSHVHLFLTFP